MSICCTKRFFASCGCQLLLVLLLLNLSACRNPIDTTLFNSLAKNDIDMIADTSLSEMNRLMEELLEKLYQHNPGELNKGASVSVGQRQNQLFDAPGRLVFSEVNNRQGTAALDMAFDPDYPVDRIFAIMTGLVGMVRSTYNWQSEQFMFDALDEQALFTSARNIEVLAWRLSHARDAAGEPLLKAGSQPGEAENQSVERLFGKMIAIQDMMAFAVVGKWERGVNSVVKRVFFLPMGL